MRRVCLLLALALALTASGCFGSGRAAPAPPTLATHTARPPRDRVAVSVTRDDLRRGNRREPERRAHVLLDGRIDVGVRADGARHLADGDGIAGGAQSGAVTIDLPSHPGHTGKVGRGDDNGGGKISRRDGGGSDWKRPHLSVLNTLGHGLNHNASTVGNTGSVRTPNLAIGPKVNSLGMVGRGGKGGNVLR